MSDEQKYTILGLNEYIRQGEPQKRERSEAWKVAIGLQQVDRLQTSEYLLDTPNGISRETSASVKLSNLLTYTTNLWQVHVFCEGNTRTTSVFMIKYLRTWGFNVVNDVFAENS